MIKPKQAIFKDREMEAKFWEKNYKETMAKGKSTKINFAKNLSESINIRLDPQTLSHVRSKAKEKGLGPTQLIRMWIMERIGNRTSPAI